MKKTQYQNIGVNLVLSDATLDLDEQHIRSKLKLTQHRRKRWDRWSIDCLTINNKTGGIWNSNAIQKNSLF